MELLKKFKLEIVDEFELEYWTGERHEDGNYLIQLSFSNGEYDLLPLSKQVFKNVIKKIESVFDLGENDKENLKNKLT